MINDTSGKLAEFMALQHLRLKGYALVACNYKTGRGTGAGEVDIIVKNQTSLVFIEVKKRKDISTAAYSILPKQQLRIRRGGIAAKKRRKQLRHYNERSDTDWRRR